MIHSIRKRRDRSPPNIETDALPQGSDKASRMPNAHRYHWYSGGCPMTVLRLSCKASVPTRFPLFNQELPSVVHASSSPVFL